MICAHRRRLFADAAHVAALTEALRWLDIEGRVEHYAWAAMPDHVHWLFRLRDGDLPQVVRLLKGRTARVIGAGGAAVWRAGFYDHALRTESELRVQARYLMENPVRAGLAAGIGVYPHAWCAWEVGV